MIYISQHKVIKSQEGKIMRTLAIFTVIFSLFLASCSSTYDASAPYDEVYASSDQPSKAVVTKEVAVQSQAVESTTAYEGDYYAPEYEEGEFDSEDYYDYEYSAKIKRFHNDNPGFDYYDSYYTNNYYYNNDPYAMSSSIYGGYGCGSPSISLSFGFGYGYGYGYGYPYYGYRPYYGYSPYWGYYDPWYYPYYGYGYGYGYGYPGYWGSSYWTGYNHGYWDGYYGGGGYYPYPDPYPGNGSYYGPRGSRTGSSDGTNRSGDLTRGTPSGAIDNNIKSFEQASRGTGMTSNLPANTVAAGRTTSGSGTAVKAPGTTGTGLSRNEGVNHSTASRESTQVVGTESRTTGKPVYTKPAASTRSSGNTNTGTQAKSNGNTTVSPSRRVQPEVKYEKPKTYNSPSARTTPSKQEYSSPSTRDSRNYSEKQSPSTRKVYTTTPERKSVSSSNSPSRTSGNSSKYNSSGSSRNYSSPSRSGSKKSYSSPSSSGSRSYSSPSKSYSSPSRSSSGGGSRSSGGGSSSGGSRSSGGGSSRGGR